MKERRINTVELRKEQKDDSMVLEGYAVVFDSPATYYGETEVINKKAFDNCDMSDVVLRYNHSDIPYTLARTRNNSLQLTVDDKGVFFHADLIPTTANKDAYMMVQSGLLDKCSFAFSDYVYEYDTDTHTTEITEIGKLFDVSLVDFPYYQDTEVEARDMEVNNIAKEVHEMRKQKMLAKLKKEELLKRL